MNNTKKILIVSISVIVLIACITFVSYGYVYTNTFGNSDIKNTTFISQSLKVLYSDGSESIISDYDSNFVPGTIITKTFTLTNIGNNDISYSIDLKDVTNTFSRKDDIVYEVSENSTVIGSGIFPSSDGTIVLGDDLYKGESKTYTLTINYLNTEDNQIVDSGATISGNLSFGVRANSLYKLNIYGNSKQNGIPSPTNPVDVVSLGNKTKNLINWDLILNNSNITKNGEGYYAKGYAVAVTGVVESLKKVLKPNVNYTISRVYTGEQDASNGSIAIRISGEMKFIVGYGAGFKSNTFSLTEEQINNITAVYFYFHQNGATISNIQLEEGSVATEYKPYGYEIPLSVESGKNLFNVNQRGLGTLSGGGSNTAVRNFDFNKYYVGLTMNNYYYPYQISSYSIEENSITITANSSGYGIGFPFEVKANTTYTVSKTGTNSIIGVGFYTKDGSYIKYTLSNTFTTPENCGVAVLVLRPGVNNEAITYSNLQLEEGDKATSYEPYKYTYVKSFYLDEPLRSVGACDTCYDYIDLVEKKVYRIIKEDILDGSESWSLPTSIVDGYSSFRLTNYFEKYPVENMMCTHFISYPNSYYSNPVQNKVISYLNTNQLIFLVSNDVANSNSQTTVSNWATWLHNEYSNGTSVMLYKIMDKYDNTETIEINSISEFIGKKLVVCDSNGICASKVEQI